MMRECVGVTKPKENHIPRLCSFINIVWDQLAEMSALGAYGSQIISEQIVWKRHVPNYHTQQPDKPILGPLGSEYAKIF